jgi:hypothetical protein
VSHAYLKELRALRSSLGWSGEVDVVSEARLTGTIKQPKQRDTLLPAGSTSDDNDNALMWLGRCQMHKVVPVAGR